MTDNVISLEDAKGGLLPKQTKAQKDDDETLNLVKLHNIENLETFVKGVGNGEVRALFVIGINYDGSVSWSLSGMSSDFEIIAALERSKIDFMGME